MAQFRPRQSGEDLGAYLKAKQDYEMQTTGQSGIDFGSQGYTPSVPPSTPPTTGGSETGDTRLDEALNIFREIQAAMRKNDQMINPKIEITPDKVAEFMNLAATNLDTFLPYANKEIAPYYQTQLKLAKDTFLKDLGYNQEDILKQEQDIERKYGQNLRTLGEQARETGFLYGGTRKRQEQDLAYDTQQQIEQNRRNLERAAESTAGQFAQQWGSQAITAPTITQAPRVLSGIGTFERPTGMNPLYQLSDDIYSGLIGEQQYAEKAAKQRRAAELETGYRASEAEKQYRALETY